MEITARCSKIISEFDDPSEIDFRDILSRIDIEDILWEKERRKINKIMIQRNLDIPVNTYKGRNLTSADRSLRTFYRIRQSDVLISASNSELDYQIDNRELMDLEKRLETLLNFKMKEEIHLQAALCSLNRAKSEIKKVKDKIRELKITQK
jgi:hypothetical protein